MNGNIKLNLLKLSQVEILIQAGLLGSARKQLSLISAQDLYAADIVYLCSLLRRSGNNERAIQILQPLIYPKARRALTATTEEKLEYASCLVRLEITAEAARVLDTISIVLHPIALIRKSFLCISNWDYEQSNKYLMQYIEHTKATPYDRLIAQVNLLQGYVLLENITLAEPLYHNLCSLLDANVHKLLLAATYEFGSEIDRLKLNYTEALIKINLANQLINNDSGLDGFLIRKQEWIVKSYATENKSIDLKYNHIKMEAQLLKHYESLRDLDLHYAVLTKNSELLTQVYWKTKSQYYKNRVSKVAHNNNLSINKVKYQYNKCDIKKNIIFNLNHATFNKQNIYLSKNKALHRLFMALLSEGYRPIKLYDFFCTVYSDEVFVPEHSNTKIRQLLKRLRHQLAKLELPITIVCKNDNYYLHINANLIVIENINTPPSWYKLLIKKYRQIYFNNQDAQKVWGMSKRSSIRRINELKNLGLIKAYGKTNNRKYKIV